MSYFKVILSGTGIEYSFEGADLPVIGFSTTRLVRASNLGHAELVAKQLVLKEWQAGGRYAAANRGLIPSLTVEQSFPIGHFAGIFGRRPAGYSFYQLDD